MKHNNLIQVNVSGLTIDPFTNMPIIILKNEEETMALPVWIGLIEASSIATELEKVELARPMTHDLMRNILERLGAHVDYVEITDLTDNTFFAQVHLINEKGQSIQLDCRPSDAIALALRTKAIVYVRKDVVEKSRQIDLAKDVDEGKIKEQKWAELLENLSSDDFGKYKM